MRRLSAIVVFFLCLVYTCASSLSHFDLNSQQFVDDEYRLPTYENETTSDDKIIVSFSLGTVSLIEDDLFPESHNIFIDRFGQKLQDGKPILPMADRVYTLPESTEFSYIRLLSYEYVEIDVTLAPSRPFLSDNDSIGWTKKNIQPISRSIINAPDSVIKLEYVGNRFGKKVCRVSLLPVQYDSDNHKIRVYRDFSFEIGLIQSENDTHVLTGDDDEWETKSSNIPIHRSYLILAPSSCKDSIHEFSSWKRKSGYNVITLFSDKWTPEKIESSIDSVYYSKKDLRYVMLIGDHSVMPGKKIYSTNARAGYYISDYDYSAIAPSIERNVFIGRIPGRNNEEIHDALEKITTYEMNPPKGNFYYTHSLHSAYFQPSTQSSVEARRFVRTAEDVLHYVKEAGINAERNYFTDSYVSPKNWSPTYADGKEIPQCLQRPEFAWNGNNKLITSFFEKGGLYALYRGHGEYNMWDKPRFSVNDILSSHTTTTYPIVFSTTCLSGRFDLSQDCFAQTLINSKQKGSIGVIAASEISYSGLNDAMINGMFNEWFKGDGFEYIYGQNIYPSNSPINAIGSTLGEILEAGLARMLEIYPSYGSNSTPIYNRNIYHLFGDPSMQVHTKKPTSFSGVSVKLVPFERFQPKPSNAFNGLIQFSIKEAGEITITDNYGISETCYGTEMKFDTPTFPCEIVVTGHNKIPLIYTYYSPASSDYPQEYNHWYLKLSPNPANDIVNILISYDSHRVNNSNSPYNHLDNFTSDTEYVTQTDNILYPIEDYKPLIRSIEVIIQTIDGKGKSRYIHADPDTEKIILDVSEFNNGTYLVGLLIDGAITDTQKLIIQH